MDKPISSDAIYKDLLNRIISLEIEPGSKISENKICDEYNVSRSVIRNVFAKLTQLKMITVYPQRGTYVNKIDLDYIQNALLIRIAIEKEMLRRFMKLEDKSDTIEKMNKNIEQQKKFYYEKEYIDEFKELDDEFHKYIILSTENKNILELLDEHLLHISRWRNVYIKSGHKVGDLIDEHIAILDAIVDGDESRAIDCMSNHIVTVNDVVNSLEVYKDYFLSE